MTDSAHPPLSIRDGELFQLQVLSESLRGCTTVLQAARLIVQVVAELAELEDAVVFTRQASVLTQRAAYGPKSPDGETLIERIGVPLGSGIVGGAGLRRRPRYVPDISESSDYIPDVFPGRSEYAVPILHRGELVGVLDSESSEIDGFSPRDRQLMRSVADISAPNFAALLSQESERGAVRYNDVIAEMARLPLLARGDLEAAFATVVERTARALRTSQACLWLRSEDNAECVARYDIHCNSHQSSGERIPQAEFPEFFAALASERVIAAPDAQADARTRGLPPASALSMMYAPIRIDGKVAGVLMAQSFEERRNWTEDESSFIGTMADFATLTLLTNQKYDAEAALVHSQRLEAVGRLAGGVAHDFNNLLTVINGGVDLLLRDTARQENPGELLKMIAQAGARAQKLTRQLLAFGRQQKLNIAVIDAADLLRSVQMLTEHVIREDIKLEFDIDHGPQWIAGDSDQLEQVITNLMLNAADAMPMGGGLHVALRAASDATEDVWLTVTDTGGGIARDMQHRVFEPFFTTKGEFGSGLGLSVSLGIVEQHSGELRLLRSDDGGTSFGVRLPRQAAPAEVAVEAEEEERLGKRTGSVMLVEDEQGVRDVVFEMLQRLGYETVVADNASDALQRLQHSPVDLLITDVVMPDLRGPQLWQLACKIQPDLRVLYISGYAESAMMDLPGGPQQSTYLGKPFTTAELDGAIRRLLELNVAGGAVA